MTQTLTAPTQTAEGTVEERLRQELYDLHARFCQGLSDPKRLLIIAALRDGEKSVTQLAQAAGARPANTSQHLALMRHLGLVFARRAENNTVYYRLADQRIVQAVDLLRAVQADQQALRASALLNQDWGLRTQD